MAESKNSPFQHLALSVEDQVLLFQAALEQSYNSVVITDANIEGGGPYVVYANPSFEKMTGYSLAELIGKSPKILQGPLTDRRVIDELRSCIRTGNFFEGSTINYNKAGHPYNVEWSISPIRDQSGVIQYFISVQKNITAFIKAQQERNLLVKALNDSPDCVIITDIDHRIVFVNTGFEQLTGYEQEEVLGRDPSFLWQKPADSEKDQPENSRKITHFQLQCPNLRKDGTPFYVDQSIAHITDDAGNVSHYVSFSKDSTERLRRELTLTDLASRDSLTGLLNRRSGEQLLKQYDDEKQPTGKLLCLIMMDIDNFKKINDTFGHTIGDVILKSCSHLIKNKARNTDSIIRWGGEEFLIIVPSARLHEAMELAERIRASIEQHTDSKVGQITASFGVAELQPDETTASLLNRADKALYKAKFSGKNCIKPSQSTP